MGRWNEAKIKEFAEVKGGKRLPKGKKLVKEPNTHPYIKIKDLGKTKYLQLNSDYEYVDDETQQSIARYIVNEGDILISVVGTIGLIGIVGNTLDKANQTENCDKIINIRNVLPEYLYYYLISKFGQDEIKKGTVGAVQPKLPLKNVQDISVLYPSIEEQERIVKILGVIDEKIEINDAINNNLEQQVLTLYRNKFVDTVNNERQICRVDEYFDISIGKTPPRKEPQWFSKNPQDVTWVSISDMGTCGLYISSSSEQLTKAAIDRYNVKVVPDNTVLLSFKLTVGRIAITNGEMSTNEAIAHFKTNKKEINEYLYCYLKYFNYQTMGSTSSIATAVNSKIIKSMKFIIPTDEELKEFHNFAEPIFAKIKVNQIEKDNLTTLRDTLLPKLISGELDISNINL
jgi:type I restriction enzyme S subunit|nr:MAG TPA: hypothetical protein [Caudoviricetes sp.]